MSTVKFAVVREDPQPELDSLTRSKGYHALLVASGGCTAFHLQHALPDLKLDLFDINQCQLVHVRQRSEAIAQQRYSDLNINEKAPSGLSQCGVFEKFFRVFRQIFIEFISCEEEVEAFFGCASIDRQKIVRG